MIWTLIGRGCSESERENTNEERWLSISQKRVCVLCFQGQTTNTETSPDVRVSVVVESCMYCIESGYHSFQCDVWMCYCTIVDNVNLSEWEAAACFEKSEVFSVSDLLTMAQRSFVVAATKLNFLCETLHSMVITMVPVHSLSSLSMVIRVAFRNEPVMNSSRIVIIHFMACVVISDM